MQEIQIPVQGMSCGHCVARVTKALEGTPGVRVKRVTVGSAVVEIDSGNVDRPSVERAITAAGFQVGAAPSGGGGCCSTTRA